MASLSRGISFRRQGSSGMSWTDTWSFNEEGVLVRTLKDEHHLQQRFAGSSLSRIHDSHHDDDQEILEEQTSSCPPPSSSFSSSMSTQLERSKSVGSSQVLPPPSAHHKPAPSHHTHKPAPSVFKWIKRALYKMKK